MKIIFTYLTTLSVFISAFELNQSFDGHFTYYSDGHFGACGDLIDAGSQQLAAVGPDWFTSTNPNEDPVCKKCLKVEYEGKM